MVDKVNYTQPRNDSDGGQSETHPAWLMMVVVGRVNYTQPNDSGGGQSEQV